MFPSTSSKVPFWLSVIGILNAATAVAGNVMLVADVGKPGVVVTKPM